MLKKVARLLRALLLILKPKQLLKNHRWLWAQVGDLSRQIDSLVMFGHLGVQTGPDTPRTSEKDMKQLLGKFRVMEVDANLIRVGSEIDGGYVLPDLLNPDLVCFSAGVHLNSDFELDLAKRGIKSHLIDFSVAGPVINHELFGFQRKFLSGTTFLDSHVTLDDWVGDLEKDRDLLLKMDIEGSEWAVLSGASSETLNRFNLMVIEFHGLDRLGFAGPFSIINGVLNRILEGFDIVNAHPNNYRGESIFFGARVPEVLEITFVNKRLNISGARVATGLRAPNLPNNPVEEEIELDNYWFTSAEPNR
jgi:hypothetical protein